MYLCISCEYLSRSDLKAESRAHDHVIWLVSMYGLPCQLILLLSDPYDPLTYNCISIFLSTSRDHVTVPFDSSGLFHAQLSLWTIPHEDASLNPSLKMPTR
jgi:hypothetical protein